MAAVLVTPLAAACGAGQVAQTSRVVASVEGASATRGGVSVSNAVIAYPSSGSYQLGDDVPLYVAIVTEDTTSDTLVSVTTDAAGSVVLVAVPVRFGSSGSPSPATSTSESAAASAAGSAAPSASASPGAAQLDVPLAAASLRSFSADGDYLQLTGIVRELRSGTTVNVTFSFAEAGDITLHVPVATPDEPLPRPSPSESAAEG